ncbi:DegT/DnrJ/EryC1/StrS aminotransferase family protein [Candidatus Pelagibacter sp.]|nr:DegT/DnrJ/EryC1/StrS aminotransferase family protein [Candidatus Pelagibacter sp.]
MMNKIPYGKCVYGNEEINNVLKCLKKSTQMGNEVSTFEEKIAKLFGKNYGIMVNSGSSALTLAIKVLNLPKNSEIITPCLNFGTAISSIIFNGHKPIFVDVNKETLQIDISLIEKKINKKTKALLIPNLIGNVPDWIKINKIAKKYKLKIIEDSADTLGGKIKNRPTGTYSDISITSFYGSHVISCAGNGGMLMLNSKSLYDKAKILRSWGRLSSTVKDSENIKNRLNISLSGIDYDRKFVFSELGYNFEPSEIGAAFGNVQLKKFKKFSKIRNINFNYHANFFKKFSDFFIIPKVLPTVSTNFLSYPIIMKENKKFSRKQLQVFMENSGVQTRPIFTGNLLRHPAFKFLNNKNNNVNSFPESDYIMKYGLLIGCHQGLDLKSLDKIHNIVKIFLNKIR